MNGIRKKEATAAPARLTTRSTEPESSFRPTERDFSIIGFASNALLVRSPFEWPHPGHQMLLRLPSGVDQSVAEGAHHRGFGSAEVEWKREFAGNLGRRHPRRQPLGEEKSRLESAS